MSEKKLQKLPIGIQHFEQLRAGDYLYVDKTKDLYNLATTGQVYFISRPRRFGKSMLCSTFEALFEGKKHLFDGTWIASSDWQWQSYPIIKLSFADIPHATPEELTEHTKKKLTQIALKYNLQLEQTTLGAMLDNLIDQLSVNVGPVVMLVDEYDKPLINNLQDTHKLNAFRKVMKAFYGCLKDSGKKMRFLFITGVSKFSMVSIFSDMNHLKILSDSPRAATICGYTQAELEHAFAAYIERAMVKFGYTREQMLAEIKNWYNGYCFADPDNATNKVYNPFSIINFFDDFAFKNYWFNSGTPTFAIDYFKKHGFEARNFEQVEVSMMALDTLKPESLSLTTLLYQTGYLTIKKYENEQFVLGFPNREIASCCSEGLLDFMQQDAGTALFGCAKKLKALFLSDNLSVEAVMALLQTACLHIPYTIKPGNERGYQLAFYLMLQMVGLPVEAERVTSLGRIDLALLHNNQALVIELKIRGKADKAIKQILEKRYAQIFIDRGMAVTMVGIVFDVVARTVTSCAVQRPADKAMHVVAIRRPAVKKKSAKRAKAS